FLDDAPLEERRTQAVMARRYADAESADDLGRLDPGAIDAVRAEAWPEARNADEVHEALLGLGFITAGAARDNQGWLAWLAELSAAGRATLASIGEGIWIAAERLPQVQALTDAEVSPAIRVPDEFAVEWTPDTAACELVRSRLTGLGPTTTASLAAAGVP